MAANSIGGDGLVQAHIALEALIENPEQFEQAMHRRFTETPPSWRTRPGTPTVPPSRVDENDPLQKYLTRRNELRWDWMASSAAGQFITQTREELRRIDQARESLGVVEFPMVLADDRVRERWVEQGIWDPKWYESNLEKWGEWARDTPMLDALWLHEKPPEDDNSDSDDDQPVIAMNLISGTKRQKTEEEARQSVQRSAERRRRREVRRPIHQFNYQVSHERERLVEERAREAPNDDLARLCPPDISTQAYTIVKDRWVRQRIWIDKWGILPGMTWLHERDFDELLLEELGPRPPPDANAVASPGAPGLSRQLLQSSRSDFLDIFTEGEVMRDPGQSLVSNAVQMA